MLQLCLIMKIEKNLLYQLIGSKLRKRRENLGKTQESLSQDLRISRTSVTNIESGLQKLPLDLLYEICGILDIEVTEIIPSTQELKKKRNIKVHGQISDEVTQVINELIDQKS